MVNEADASAESKVDWRAVPYRDRPVGSLAGYPLLFFAGGGLMLSVFLRATSMLLKHVPGCKPGVVFDCNQVLSGAWSKWMHIPVSALGAMVYLVMFLAVLFLPMEHAWRRRIAWRVLFFLSLCAVGAGVWFTFVQYYYVKSYCPYCIATHLCGLAVLIIVLIRAPLSHRSTLVSTGIAMLVTGVLVGGQVVARPDVLSMPPPLTTPMGVGIVEDSGPGEGRKLLLRKDKVPLRVSDFPVQGSPDAKRMVVQMFDYTCPVCRHMHAMLAQARTIYAGQLGVVSVAMPLSRDCNAQDMASNPRFSDSCELARLSLAVWRADPAAWMTFHYWVFENEAYPDQAAARAKAEELVGKERLAAIRAEPWIEERIRAHQKLYDEVGERESLPIVLWGPKRETGPLEQMEFDLGLIPIGPGPTMHFPPVKTQPATTPAQPATQPSAP